jgi:hypothetical protein
LYFQILSKSGRKDKCRSIDSKYFLKERTAPPPTGKFKNYRTPRGPEVSADSTQAGFQKKFLIFYFPAPAPGIFSLSDFHIIR